MIYACGCHLEYFNYFQRLYPVLHLHIWDTPHNLEQIRFFFIICGYFFLWLWAAPRTFHVYHFDVIITGIIVSTSSGTHRHTWLSRCSLIFVRHLGFCPFIPTMCMCTFMCRHCQNDISHVNVNNDDEATPHSSNMHLSTAKTHFFFSFVWQYKKGKHIIFDSIQCCDVMKLMVFIHLMFNAQSAVLLVQHLHWQNNHRQIICISLSCDREKIYRNCFYKTQRPSVYHWQRNQINWEKAE